ncbi:alpha/beta-hydrolase [Gymnopus androsaceus JB14]|uniref:Alpha/beta-hydrolase n=1 Tax=Gymnopus androsaceus JB14 TaxID=1447944 RepID=A0A6A4IKP8_9AGAR|nr:alpha/beta-hydrolase [Gymnopus androsaceus JB14]
MGVSTFSAAVHITPVVIETFFKHGKRRAQKFKDSIEEEEARDDILFDEAFNIVKAFIELGIRNTIESLQSFTNTHVAAPYWAAVAPIRIPLSVCNDAADILIEWFGPEELKHVVGGERWWQVRGLDGLDAEWITEKEYLSDSQVTVENLPQQDQTILQMEYLETVMLYVHGGGFSWGSINTHRYQLIRYARKIRGRVFAVNYRKAPQYPWPCPLHDVLTAYLYLIRPPPGARHKAVPPSKIVFAGDSAGGNLCLTTLTVLRDLGIPMPSGAILISPWVDLTHSFASVMTNTETDIIPAHGFLAKPSTLWPVDLIPPEGGRVGPTHSSPPPDPGHADTLLPTQERIQKDQAEDNVDPIVQSQESMLEQDKGSSPSTLTSQASGKSKAVDAEESTEATPKQPADDHDIDLWEPKPPKVLMEDPDAVPLELRSQIQQYATTEQLTHPLVSPIVQGSLGGLPPLYIIAGDGEVLRDEIIHLAHRAAHPAEYPARSGVLRDGNRQKANAAKFTTPTKVHLQVFDSMCHVLTVFSFTQSAKFAYRSIAEFTKHIVNNETGEPFPELQRPPSRASVDSEALDEHKKKRPFFKRLTNKTPPSEALRHQSTGVRLYNQEAAVVADQLRTLAQEESSSQSSNVLQGDRLETSNDRKDGAFIMIRERVDIHGVTRDMEPREELPCLQISPSQIGLIKEAPAVRWNKGQEQWDRVFAKEAQRVLKRRQRIERKAEEMLRNAREQGFYRVGEEDVPGRAKAQNASTERSTAENPKDGTIQEGRRWGPLDLDDERPPPSAIAKRRDTTEALALLKMAIYHSAPVTHRTVPKLKAIDAVKAAFDPHDDPMRPPKQSVSEQQVRSQIIPGMHGLRLWDAILGYFMEENSKRAAGYLKDRSDRAGALEERKAGKDAR